MTPRRAASILGVTPDTVVKWAERGYLTFYKTPGGQRRFREADVRALLAVMNTPAAPAEPEAELAG